LHQKIKGCVCSWVEAVTIASQPTDLPYSIQTKNFNVGSISILKNRGNLFQNIGEFIRKYWGNL